MEITSTFTDDNEKLPPVCLMYCENIAWCPSLMMKLLLCFGGNINMQTKYHDIQNHIVTLWNHKILVWWTGEILFSLDINSNQLLKLHQLNRERRCSFMQGGICIAHLAFITKAGLAKVGSFICQHTMETEAFSSPITQYALICFDMYIFCRYSVWSCLYWYQNCKFTTAPCNMI